MKFRSLPIFLWTILPALALAQQTPQSLADAELASLLAIYKDIHTHPELSGHEERTASLIAKELRAAGCQVTEHLGKYENSKLKGYGVVGVMKNGDGPTVLVRTDMDALPVTEDTGLPYGSKPYAASGGARACLSRDAYTAGVSVHSRTRRDPTSGPGLAIS